MAEIKTWRASESFQVCSEDETFRRRRTGVICPDKRQYVATCRSCSFGLGHCLWDFCRIMNWSITLWWWFTVGYNFTWWCREAFGWHRIKFLHLIRTQTQEGAFTILTGGLTTHITEQLTLVHICRQENVFYHWTEDTIWTTGVCFVLDEIICCSTKSSQVTFIYIALYTIQIVSKQLYRDKQENNYSMMQRWFLM